jgi:hypothetical protein
VNFLLPFVCGEQAILEKCDGFNDTRRVQFESTWRFLAVCSRPNQQPSGTGPPTGYFEVTHDHGMKTAMAQCLLYIIRSYIYQLTGGHGEIGLRWLTSPYHRYKVLQVSIIMIRPANRRVRRMRNTSH